MRSASLADINWFCEKEISVTQRTRWITVNIMKEWQVTLGGAFVMLVAALGMFLWANSIAQPVPVSQYNFVYQYLLAFIEGVSDYTLIHNQYFLTFNAGVLFTGVGGGFLICTILIYPIEKKLATLESTEQNTQT